MTERVPVGSSATLKQKIGRLRERLSASRISIARLDDDATHFNIETYSGKPLLGAGPPMPVALSTQILQTVQTGRFWSADYTNDERWHQPVDEVTLGFDFVSGAAVLVQDDAAPLAVVSVSRTTPMPTPDRDLAELSAFCREALPQLRAQPPSDPALVCLDSPLVSLAYARILDEALGVHAVALQSIEEVHAWAKDHRSSVVIGDVFFDGLAFSATTKLLRDTGSAAPVVILTHHDDEQKRWLAHACGAVGYCGTSDSIDKVTDVLSKVLDGKRVPPMASRDAPPPPEVRLTGRERDVLRLLDEGHKFREIAQQLSISETTVKSYGRALFHKLQAHSRTEAVNEGRRRGFLSPVP